MKYKLVYTKKAVKHINRLDSVVKKRLKKALEKFIERPFYFAEKLTDSRLGEYRWRMGDYRIIFDYKNSNVIILCVGHRREIYR